MEQISNGIAECRNACHKYKNGLTFLNKNPQENRISIRCPKTNHELMRQEKSNQWPTPPTPLEKALNIHTQVANPQI